MKNGRICKQAEDHDHQCDVMLILQTTVVALIDQGFQPYVAPLIVGGATFLIAFILALIGVNQLKVKKLAPCKTSSRRRRRGRLLLLGRGDLVVNQGDL